MSQGILDIIAAFTQFINNLRIIFFKAYLCILQQLIHSDMSMEELAAYLNFATSASFSKFFKTHKGVSPLKYKLLHKNS